MVPRKRRRFPRVSLTPVRHELTGDAHVDALAREATIAKRTAQLRSLAGLLLLFMAVATFGSLYLLVTIANDNHTGVQRLVDCTTPGGICFKQQRDPENNRTVDYLKEVTILAASCAKIPTNTTADEVRKCVEVELAKG